MQAAFSNYLPVLSAAETLNNVRRALTWFPSQQSLPLAVHSFVRVNSTKKLTAIIHFKVEEMTGGGMINLILVELERCNDRNLSAPRITSIL